jgi:hypothetical protein
MDEASKKSSLLKAMKIICFRNNLKDNNCIFIKYYPIQNKTLKHYYFFLVFLFLVPVSISKSKCLRKGIIEKELKAIN